MCVYICVYEGTVCGEYIVKEKYTDKNIEREGERVGEKWGRGK